MTLAPREKVVLRGECPEDWEEVGSGGFGRVYKAWHKDWGLDVAVKVLKRDASHIIFKEKEAKFMDKASFDFVLKLHGIYEGPKGEKGLVTEYMKRGSIETLQKKLGGPPPWPLAFRLAHQTALAMNFLHRQDIVHLDLKPSNILLSDELNARLADFGLSTVSMSVVGRSTDGPTGPRGTYKYMPPEAFEDTYKPVRAFDIYSFGILLWSIFSGKEPYPGRNYSDVEDLIPEGGRPGCRNNQADLLSLQVVGIKELVDLMRKCWDHNPTERPQFRDVHETTKSLFDRHERNVRRAVDDVLEKLDPTNQANLQPLNQHHVFIGAQLNDVVDHPLVMEVTQASARGDSSKTKNRKEKAKFVEDQRNVLIQRVTHALAIAEELGVGKIVHSETYSTIKALKKSQDQIRELYDILKAGEKVKAAFYDALKIHEAPLMEELEE